MNWPLTRRLVASAAGRRQHECSMRSMPVVVVRILGQDRAEMTFADDQPYSLMVDVQLLGEPTDHRLRVPPG